MSRRESRVSMNVRQNDALNEFENFKKKFLLANKHITKLNSTLSVRIEELNAQISTLYVENLRLRASEIALAAQLQREREKSWRIMTDAETATHNLSKHLGHMRKAYNISHSSPSPPQQPPAPSSRTRRPMPDPAASPQTTRLSRAPNVPGIYEDDEDCEASSSPDETERAPSPTIRRKMKARLSASRLPLPSRVSSPPLPSAPPLVIESKGKRKVNRRQSGLLTVDTARPPSPAVGSAIQKLAQEAEPDEEEEAAVTEEMDVDAELEAALRRERKNKSKEQEREADGEVANESSRPRERKRRRDNEEASGTTTSNSEGANKLKDVTNSPRGRSALPPLDTTTSDRERQQTPETEPTTGVSAAPSSLLPYPSNESTPATTPAPSDPHSSAYLPTPRQSSSPPPAPASDTEGPTAAGRATRTRKSVNYAEPKLNTKMRKPDSEPSSTGTKKRSSMSAKSQPQSQSLAAEDLGSQPLVENVSARSKKRSSVSANAQPPPPLPADDPEPRSSSEIVAPPSRNHNQPQEIKSRPALPPSQHLYPQVQIQPPRSTSGPSSSSTSTSTYTSTSFRPISSSHTYVTTPAPNSSATTTIKRKKSRPYVDPDDLEDSDGAQADAEFGGTGLTNGWVNVDGRRKSVLHGHGGAGNSRERERSGERRLEGEEVRRHSMAV